MSPKVVLFALLCAGSCLATAQSVNLSFPDDGDRQIWIASSLPSQAPGDTDGIRTNKSEANLPIKDEKDSANVFVWDRRSGNLASKSVKDAKAQIWVVKPEDFKTIAQVTVHVEHDGKPIAAATVDLDDGKRKTSQLVDPSCSGTVSFFGVKPGSLTASVHYKSKGKDATPIKQLLDVGLERSVPIPSIQIALVDDVDTVGKPTSAPPAAPDNLVQQPKDDSSAGGTKPESDKAPSSKEGGNFFGSLLVYLIALGAMAAAIYYAVMYVKKNPDSVGSKLEQLGVQIPKPGDDPLANPSQIPAAKPTPMPVQKIILDDAAPGPIAPAPAPSAIVNPRLVSQTGDAMPIPEGEFSVGREIGLGLSLVGETTVSRKHANLIRNGSQVKVIDFGSTNGMFVNGVQVHGESQLQSGDTVQFGSVRFRFEG